MSRRHVAYVKPNEPSFLRKLKEQAGYKEGPTIDTKRENYGDIEPEDLQDTEEEEPTVVVLKAGDLTAEEAAREKERLRNEEEATPADLNAPIVFKAPSKTKSEGTIVSKRKVGSTEGETKSKKPKKKPLLSFDEEENDD